MIAPSPPPTSPYARVRACIMEAIERAYLGKNQRGRSLVMLSGGLDSVALLAKLLEHTNHDVHVHHVEIHNAERRVEAENAALEKVLPYLREHYRDFTYTISKYELMVGLGGGLDMTLALFMGARLTIATECLNDMIWTGHYAETPAHEIAESSAVFAACFSNVRYKPIWLTPFRQCKKLDVYASIPRELLDMTWSCRTPLYEGGSHKPCGACHACKTRAEMIAQLR